ncbi:hypothetical protein [Sphaerisporangium sp. NPDC051011]|uniref:hypothetical protein n=1 Tax=Sphaerisporangium sp. NPDC051011 TaxID=3155792 RepID=UPI0033CB5BB6
MTALPVAFGAIGLSLWVGLIGSRSMPLVKALLPTGATTQLSINAWNGGVPLGGNPSFALPTLGWILVALIMVRLTFHWEPRR